MPLPPPATLLDRASRKQQAQAKPPRQKRSQRRTKPEACFSPGAILSFGIPPKPARLFQHLCVEFAHLDPLNTPAHNPDRASVCVHPRYPFIRLARPIVIVAKISLVRLPENNPILSHGRNLGCPRKWLRLKKARRPIHDVTRVLLTPRTKRRGIRFVQWTQIHLRIRC